MTFELGFSDLVLVSNQITVSITTCNLSDRQRSSYLGLCHLSMDIGWFFLSTCTFLSSVNGTRMVFPDPTLWHTWFLVIYRTDRGRSYLGLHHLSKGRGWLSLSTYTSPSSVNRQRMVFPHPSLWCTHFLVIYQTDRGRSYLGLHHPSKGRGWLSLSTCTPPSSVNRQRMVFPHPSLWCTSFDVFHGQDIQPIKEKALQSKFDQSCQQLMTI